MATLAPVVAGPLLRSTLAEINKRQMYTPDPNFSGVDTFAYQINNSNAVSAATAVSITVREVNNPPTVTMPANLLEVGLGFERIYTGTIEEVDAVDMHLIRSIGAMARSSLRENWMTMAK